MGKKFPVIFFFLSLLINSSVFGQDTVRTYYSGDFPTLKEVYIKVNGVAQGVVKRYDEERNLILIGHLKDDKKEGLFTIWTQEQVTLPESLNL
ncbi:hypothetical protein V8V91_26900 [Algoriphagus halophilus]|uniref:hypothetical protein n=1 Tax=Algoriphagus halophilus TaxID=226505 RepID=UPI00358ECF2D